MNAAASSWFARMVRRDDWRSASKNSTFCDPGNPKTCLTPRFSSVEQSSFPPGAFFIGLADGSARATKLICNIPEALAKFGSRGAGESWSRSGFVDHFFPDAFGFQDEFHSLANGATSGDRSRGEMGRLLNFMHRIADSDCESDAPHHR